MINSVYMCTIIFLSWLFMEINSGVQLLTWCLSIHRRYRVSVWPWQKNQLNYRSTLLKCIPNIALSFILCQEIFKQYTVTNDFDFRRRRSFKASTGCQSFFYWNFDHTLKIVQKFQAFQEIKQSADWLSTKWNISLKRNIQRVDFEFLDIAETQKFKYLETNALNFPPIKKINST